MMSEELRSWLSITLIVLIIVAGVAGFFIGFEYGFHRGSANSSDTQNQLGVVNSSSPISSSPYTYDFSIGGNSSTAYVPMVYLPVNYPSSVYVQYECPSSCEEELLPNIGSFNVTSYIPLVFAVESNGTMTKSSNVQFNSSTIIQENNDSEILVYNLSNEGNNSGYYALVFPYTCELQPVLYIGSHATDVDFDLVRNWLQTNFVQSVKNCPETELDLNLLGFTNTYYNHLTVSFAMPAEAGNST